MKTPKGILKPVVGAAGMTAGMTAGLTAGVKPPVPSRSKINEILRGGSTSSDDCLGENF